MLIGLSVSSCIRQMVDGEVDPNQVAYIIGGINPLCGHDTIEEGLNSISESYNRTYWRKGPDYETLFREMFAEGRILCPRMASGETDELSFLPRILCIADGSWLAGEQVHRVEEHFGEPEWM